MALDESGGYDLARGFDTLITGNKAIEQAVRDLQSSVMAALTMQRDMTMGASRQSPASMNPQAAGALAQPSPTSGQTIAAPGIPGQGGVVPQGVSAPQPTRPVGDPLAGSTKPAAASPFTGLGTPVAPTADSGSGMLDSVLNILPFGDKISEAMSFGREQRDKNAQFQQIEGGSNLSGIAERAHQKAYQMATAGMFSGEEADKAFMGVTALGYNNDYGSGTGGGGAGEGPGRQDMLNFAHKQKSANGMAVDESLQHMDVFAKSASAGLTSFSDALIQVSEAAGQAGVNAMEARAMFSQMFSQGTSAGFGQGATSFAQTMTNQSVGYGRAYATGVDMSGTTAQSTVRLQSAMMGKTYGQTITAEQSGVNVMAQGQAAGVSHLIGLLPPDAVKWAKDQIAANPSMTDEDVTNLGNELMKKSKMDPAAILQIAQTFTGKDYGGNYELVMEEIVRSLMGQGATASMKSGGLMDGDSYKDLGKTQTAAYGAGSVGRGGGAVVGPQTVESTQSDTAAAYVSMADAGGEGTNRVGTLEQVLNKLDPSAQDSQMVKINGKEMSLKDIIESGDPKLMRKVAMGKGTMVGGEFEGQKIGEVATADQTSEDSANLDTTATDVNVTIDFSQYAKDMLTETHNVDAVPAGG